MVRSITSFFKPSEPVIPISPSLEEKEGFKNTRMTENIENKIFEIHRCEKEITRPAYWSDFKKINLCYPLGYSDKSAEERRFRFYGYFPILGFVSGGAEMYLAISSIFKVIIQNENQFEIKERRKDEKQLKIFEKRTICKIELSYTQKITVFMVCFATYFRGIITFLQCGIIFAPFDFATNLIFNRNKKV